MLNSELYCIDFSAKINTLIVIHDRKVNCMPLKKLSWRNLIFILLITLCSIATGNVKAETFTVSHFPHPALNSYLDKLALAYEDLGIDLVFVEAPAERGLLLLERDLVDADFARFSFSIEGYKQAQMLPPVLLHGHVVLVCQKSVECSEDVLENKNNYIIATAAHKRYAETHFPVTARIEVHNTATNSLSLLDKQHVNYVIFAADDKFLAEISAQYNSLILGTEPLYHVINKKHQRLEKQLINSLTRYFSNKNTKP